MADPFLAEIRIFGGNFAPLGWALCNGQIFSISQNTALFSLLGTTYGGNGTSTFALPNLQGMVPMGMGNGTGLSQRALGEQGGEPAVTLLTGQMPAHNHAAQCDNQGGGVASPINATWGGTGRGGKPAYTTNTPSSPMSGQSLAVAGGNQAHNNMSPYLALSFIIALQGIYPQRN